MTMELSVHQSGRTSILQVVGSVSEVEVYRFSKAIRDVVQQGALRVAVDISKIDFIESHALGILISHFSSLQKKGRELVLINTNSDVSGYMKTLLESTRLNEMIPIITPTNQPR